MARCLYYSLKQDDAASHLRSLLLPSLPPWARAKAAGQRGSSHSMWSRQTGWTQLLCEHSRLGVCSADVNGCLLCDLDAVNAYERAHRVQTRTPDRHGHVTSVDVAASVREWDADKGLCCSVRFWLAAACIRSMAFNDAPSASLAVSPTLTMK